ncbi:putative peptidase [Wigglesworthia glossinidia endosymbiont of Glossina morsitans morsitans (Yale colony)]|uniref:tRNA N6-adenosine threonylcarbamoyltransferase n=1 Tax=Wigglesworthia glossinidia endosymbiont of Glossina morsitans morsitans (Yale colony) TaxID=1142511 RepID=H6Q5S9_WIGGL|nr:tRNA (adenosine(37)-N6)-threonylcarbamoyltransferase complex transferase subunit TsaD [Wigglesworthia glossinidia]AFA41125.1 putative peptidase [Wigglesworthia glossinidia endosymbiont of Glossina morsitans morsitans (Yale colony)]
MLILGIETSCDDTSVAIYDTKQGLIINKVVHQKNVHANYGGIVPELASEYHLKYIQSTLKKILKKSYILISDISGVAYTAGPGLERSLAIGASFACALAYSLSIPSVGIHHLEGHLLTTMLENKKPNFPFLGLIISGAHTQLILANSLGTYKILGDCLDDALGEAFDKTANLLGINYPGGKKLSILAKYGNSQRFFFPRPMIKQSGVNFSFSGLKTYVKNVICSYSKIDHQTRCDVARAFEDAILDTIEIKCRRALNFTQCKNLVIAGGVSANHAIRKRLNQVMRSRGGKLFFSKQSLCTDNAAMIAYVGSIRLKKNASRKIFIRPRWCLEDLSKP